MATNLKLAFPDLNRSATLIAHTTENASHVAENALAGSRSKLFKTSTTVTTSQLDFDVGSGSTAQPDFLLLSRLDLIRSKDSADIAVSIEGDSSSGFGTSEVEQDASVSMTDLVGPNNRDWILSTSFASAYRYFRVKITTTQSVVHEWALVYFGNLFDFGRDPSYPAQIRRSARVRGARKPVFTFSFEWRGISNTKRSEFLDVYQLRDFGPVFLYDPNDYVLEGDRLICAYITDVSITPTAVNESTIRATFEEVL